MTFTLQHGDMLEQLAEMPADSLGACVTDPPYGLVFHVAALVAVYAYVMDR